MVEKQRSISTSNETLHIIIGPKLRNALRRELHLLIAEWAPPRSCYLGFRAFGPEWPDTAARVQHSFESQGMDGPRRHINNRIFRELLVAIAAILIAVAIVKAANAADYRYRYQTAPAYRVEAPPITVAAVAAGIRRRIVVHAGAGASIVTVPSDTAIPIPAATISI